MRKLKIDYITAHDPRDIRTWSGLNYFIMKALEDQGAEINIITNLHAQPDFGLKWRWHFYNLLGKNYQYGHTHTYARQFGKQVNEQLSKDADIILSTTSPALPYIQTDKPIFIYNDATFDNIAGYYDDFSRLPTSNKKMGDDLLRMAYAKCAGLFFASDWAAESAVNFYKTNPQKTHVVPFGANFLSPPLQFEVAQSINAKSLEKVILLFVGVDFNRKGGELAIEIVQQLNNSGIESELIMVGMNNLNERNLPSFVLDEGFLDKNIPADFERLMSLYKKAHFFLLPVKKECYGVVFVEANAFGVPCITSEIPGIMTVIKNGVNGFLYNWETSTEKCIQDICAIVRQPEDYRKLALSSRQEYETRLNWTIAGRFLISKMKESLLQ